MRHYDEIYAEHSETLDFTYGASGLYLLKKAITPEQAAFDVSTLSRSDQVTLLNRAIVKATHSAADVLKTAKAQFLLDGGHLDEAINLAAQVRTDVRGD